MRFKTNPYELCVLSKDIDGSQFTIVFHVNDLKVSYTDPSVVTMIIKKLKDVYTHNFSLKDELIIARGKVHEYLGMKVIFKKEKKV